MDQCLQVNSMLGATSPLLNPDLEPHTQAQRTKSPQAITVFSINTTLTLQHILQVELVIFPIQFSPKL